MVVVQEAPKEVTNMLTVTVHDNNASDQSTSSPTVIAMTNLSDLPNEVLLQILGYLDVCDLLSTSRVSSDLFILCMSLIGTVTGLASSATSMSWQGEAEPLARALLFFFTGPQSHPLEKQQRLYTMSECFDQQMLAKSPTFTLCQLSPVPAFIGA
jgi:hypothetical protein